MVRRLVKMLQRSALLFAAVGVSICFARLESDKPRALW